MCDLTLFRILKICNAESLIDFFPYLALNVAQLDDALFFVFDYFALDVL